MNRLRVARQPAAQGHGADLYPPLCPIYPDRGSGRRRCAQSRRHPGDRDDGMGRRSAIGPTYTTWDVQGSPKRGKIDSGNIRGNVLALIALRWADPKGPCLRASQPNVAK
jgi:hypothetical protein